MNTKNILIAVTCLFGFVNLNGIYAELTCIKQGLVGHPNTTSKNFMGQFRNIKNISGLSGNETCYVFAVDENLGLGELFGEQSRTSPNITTAPVITTSPAPVRAMIDPRSAPSTSLPRTQTSVGSSSYPSISTPVSTTMRYSAMPNPNFNPALTSAQASVS